MERYLTLVTIVTWPAVTIQREHWRASFSSWQQQESGIDAPTAKFKGEAVRHDVPTSYTEFKTHNAAPCKKMIYEIGRSSNPKIIRNCLQRIH